MKCFFKKSGFFIALIGLNLFCHAYACTQPTIEKLSALEKKTNVRLGIYAINTANQKTIDFSAEERFPLQSTSKVMAVSAILYQSMQIPALLNQKISYTKKDLVSWSPITQKNLDKGMTIAELCAATLQYSDNTAMNLLVKKLGGLDKVTRFARFMGDNHFRLDHSEPNMNSDPNNPQDTGTPADMAKDLQKLMLTAFLAPAQQKQLIRWMRNNRTGDKRIRAGVPKGWKVADKTGTGSYGSANDIAIVWPPKGSPIVIAIYTVQKQKNAILREDVISSATHILMQSFGPK